MTRKGGVRVSVAGDYAAVDAGKASYYFGHEFDTKPSDYDPEDTESVYGFEYANGNIRYRISHDEMMKYRDCPDIDECAECLLFAIGIRELEDGTVVA